MFGSSSELIFSNDFLGSGDIYTNNVMCGDPTSKECFINKYHSSSDSQIDFGNNGGENM